MSWAGADRMRRFDPRPRHLGDEVGEAAVIIVDALPVYAGPIERLLTAQDNVDQAYVVGALDDRRGEAVHAFVIPRPGRSLDHAALCQAVRAELGELSVPETITELSEVPVAVSGKPDKAALLDLLAAARPATA